MKQMLKTKHAVKRAADETEVSVRTDSLADTSDAAALLAAIDELLEV